MVVLILTAHAAVVGQISRCQPKYLKKYPIFTRRIKKKKIATYLVA
jgi:hypothetical protein